MISFNPEDILAMMKMGKSADELASMYTNALNEALRLKEKEEETEKKRIAEKKAEEEAKRREHMLQDMEDILELTDDFARKYYPEYAEKCKKVTAEEMIESLEETLKIFASNELENLLKKLDKECEGNKNNFHDTMSDIDKALKDFFKHMNW